MTTQMEVLADVPVRGPSKDEDEAAWYAVRAQGITATEVAALVKAPGSRRQLLIEKLTGERVDLTGNRYIDRGNAREPVIAEWIDLFHGIAPSRHVWHTNSGRYLATPDGIGDGVLSEIKTSKHDLDPGLPGSHFDSSGYYDQMQWAMLVMNADRCLFVWEQHDDRWPDPAPVYEEPRTAWIARDPDRIDYLIGVADRFLLELEAARTAGLPPVSEMPADVALLAHDLLAARDAEAVAKARKDRAWKQLQAILLPAGDDHMENEEAKVTVSTTTATTSSLDLEAMEEAEVEFLTAWRRMQDMYEAKRAAYLVEETKTTVKLTVTANKGR